MALALPVADYVMVLGSIGQLLAFCPPSQLSEVLSPHCRPISALPSRNNSSSSTEEVGGHFISVRGTSGVCQLGGKGGTTEGEKKVSLIGRSGSSGSAESVATIPLLDNDIGAFCSVVVTLATNNNSGVAGDGDSISARNSTSDSNTSQAISADDSMTNIVGSPIDNVDSNGRSNSSGGESKKDVEKGKLVKEETKSEGEVSMSVFLFYFRSCGGVLPYLLWLLLAVGIVAST